MSDTTNGKETNNSDTVNHLTIFFNFRTFDTFFLTNESVFVVLQTTIVDTKEHKKHYVGTALL